MQDGGRDLLDGSQARPTGTSPFIRSALSEAFSPGREDMVVSTGPGLTMLIRTPSAMWSRAALRVRVATAALETA